MSEPFLAEIRIVGFNFAPRGWALCDGQILPINQNQSLFSLLGTAYGGDGETTFALPDLRGRVPIHVGNGHTLGERSGEETHTLAADELPQHRHAVQVSTSAGDTNVPTGTVMAALSNGFDDPPSNTALRPGTVTNDGGGQAHENMQPSLAINFVIALQGLFPSQD